ncbi:MULTISPECIES: MetQ/NlpA family ABC transporter substrate-binding protein [Comamonas]|jgi:D-methionine transport system substrate-binding protein|uniref:Lipoprotein n=1 Tax=Comamonas terrigena TaxID=32013 RepID=A0A2A7UXS5_COMTR|nr:MULTISPECIES: MetQ/NlpA family ABC transporter substrate-binding protein [Comamonas]MBD9531068.1 metal ABC transporter substrate-binding protein [Comamonas sp. CMM01]MBV7417073.1 metal ABC transporter substrate-binding protein [Comamonas sp. CMM03]MDH0050921.1 MetQ/NlpA family ABC transporter substrate-binding protein [Comamonas terrigena]MDH0513265.1 MetQ/NlpA family ABC transporter substrate-binding protein [Comamonas terrigena]MDH1092689.1 MetQ/NlpA family ABC transporter substrate-bindi
MTSRFVSRRAVLAASTLALVAALGTPALAQDAAKKKLLIGATAGSNYDLLQKGILPQLQKKGYQIKLVEFNDYVQPNLALSDGSLDANFFQHRAYFDQFTADRKLALSAIVQGPVAPMGVYSKKHKSLQGIQNGAKVALPNDPSNLARALLVLQQAGLVQVKPGVNPARISELDLAANPHKLKFLPLEAAQLPRVLEDADYVVVNGNFAISSGLKLNDAVVLEKTPDQYLNVVAVKTGNENSQWAKDLAAAYRSAEFKAVVDSQFAGYAKPAFLQ